MTNFPPPYDPSLVRSALAGQVEALRAVVRPFGERELALPTRLGDWRVRELTAHLDRQIGWTPQHLGDPVPDGAPADLSLTAWVAAVGQFAEALDRGTREHTAEFYAAGPVDHFDEVCRELADFLESPAAAEAERPFPLGFGVIRLGDFLVTRLVETVVHAEDLADALGRADFPHDGRALAVVAGLLVAAVPEPWRGRAAELAEQDPARWIALATGRADAAGSGLEGQLPVLS